MVFRFIGWGGQQAMNGYGTSVVVPALDDDQRLSIDPVDESVFLVDPARPTASMSGWIRLIMARSSTDQAVYSSHAFGVKQMRSLNKFRNLWHSFGEGGVSCRSSGSDTVSGGSTG